MDLAIEHLNWFENQPTLRDRFAMAALTGLLQSMFTTNGYSNTNSSGVKITASAYELADFMLSERGKK